MSGGGKGRGARVPQGTQAGEGQANTEAAGLWGPHPLPSQAWDVGAGRMASRIPHASLPPTSQGSFTITGTRAPKS